MKAGKEGSETETELKELFMWRAEGGGRDNTTCGGWGRRKGGGDCQVKVTLPLIIQKGGKTTLVLEYILHTVPSSITTDDDIHM